MAGRKYLLFAGIALAMTASVAQTKWRGSGDGKKYATLAECFGDNNSCRWIGRLVRVDDRAALARADATRAAARQSSEAVLLYYVAPADGRPQTRTKRPPQVIEPSGLSACLTAAGTVHKLPCGEKDVQIEVAH